MPSPKTAVLVTREMFSRCFAARDIERIRAVTDCRLPSDAEWDDAAQSAVIAGTEIVITGWGTRPLTTAMLDTAPDLRLMCHSAGSIKHLVSETFQARGIRVCSAAAALAVGVAEFAFGLMLVSMKAAWQWNDCTRQGVWNREKALEWVREPYGATVGIVGASLVGREMIRLCKTLELAAILLYDPYVSEEQAKELGVERVELNELMRRSDVVSLHTPATEETRHIVNARNLALLRDRAIFINTARGMCVDEPALIRELESGRIMACIDVTDPEPPAPGSPLYTLPNCILTPHVAGAIKENTHRQGRLVADEIEAYVEGRPLKHEVDLTQLHRLA
ncbi:MAG: Hydroxyacid dehydrogenase [Candidatus Hydrogenedentes bacterium]|nr:Hydroxyacid dehydrogenase [Candidatus Hydrogenedentota bacterium]